MNNPSIRSAVQLTLAFATTTAGGTCQAQYALFDSISDTIGFAGDTTLTTSATIEAVIAISAPNRGYVYFEQVNAYEHKDLTISGAGVGGAGWTYIVNETEFEAVTPISLNLFYHFAFVRDGFEERIYLNGQLQNTRTVVGVIANSPQGSYPGAIGASAYEVTDIPIPSFLGLLDSVRVSDVARYSGQSFSAPPGDMSSDANTLLLFNFNPAEVSGNTVADVSGNEHTGTLGFAGTGHPGTYTSPTIIPEPGSAMLLLVGGLALSRRSTRRPAAGKSLLQDHQH